MSENEVLPDIKKETKPNPKQVAQHMFPGLEYDKLPSNSLLNAPVHIKLILDLSSQDHDVREAIDIGERYARRFDIGKANKSTVDLALMGIDPDETENSFRLRGFIADLIHEGEQLGGVGLKPVSFRPEYPQSGVYKTAVLKTIGVFGSNGKPKAVIMFSQGPAFNTYLNIPNPIRPVTIR